MPEQSVEASRPQRAFCSFSSTSNTICAPLVAPVVTAVAGALGIAVRYIHATKSHKTNGVVTIRSTSEVVLFFATITAKTTLTSLGSKVFQPGAYNPVHSRGEAEGLITQAKSKDAQNGNGISSNNQTQNKETERAARENDLSKEGREELHRRVSKEGLTAEEIMEEAAEVANLGGKYVNRKN